MRFATVLLVVFVCSGAFTSVEGQSATPDTSTSPTPAQSKAEARVRQADESELAIKEWHSPITFDLDASWLRTQPFGKWVVVEDVPSFYCDGVTIDTMEVHRRLRRKTKAVEVKFILRLYARKQRDDKVVALEYALINGEHRLLLGRSDDLQADAGGRPVEEWFEYTIPSETFAAYTAEGSNPLLRVSMIVRNN